MFHSFKTIIQKHKIISTIVLIIIIGTGYFQYTKLKGGQGETKYVLETVGKGTIITAVSGTGQVSVSNQLDIKPKVAADVVKVNIEAGQRVKEGDILIELDNQDAQKTVRDAQIGLESARVSFQKTTQPADDLTIIQEENALQAAKDNLAKLELTQQSDMQKAQQTKQKSQDDLSKGYEDAYNAISNTFLDLPNIMSKMNDILYGTQIADTQPGQGAGWNINTLINTTDVAYRDKLQPFVNSADKGYRNVKPVYDQNFTDYKNSSRTGTEMATEGLLAETIVTTKSISDAAKSTSNMLDSWVNYRTEKNWPIFTSVTQYQTNISTYIGQLNSHVSDLLTIQRGLQDNKEAVTNAAQDLKQMSQNAPLDIASAEQSIKEKETSIQKMQQGADALDIQTQQLTVRQRQNDLADAQQKLADYTVRAPFDGIVAVVNVKKGDPASSGTAVATLISQQGTADISLNEIDIAKVKTGEKATMTFDAVPDLTLTGSVIEIDTIGTVTQGVVTYNVKIGFDAQDERVKPGMSVSASIITEVKQDVLTVSNSAVKTQGNRHVVQIVAQKISDTVDTTQGVPLSSPPTDQMVQIGLVNDDSTEITSGLKEGDQVVTKIIEPSTTKTTTTAPSILSNIGGRGGATRALGR